MIKVEVEVKMVVVVVAATPAGERDGVVTAQCGDNRK